MGDSSACNVPVRSTRVLCCACFKGEELVGHRSALELHWGSACISHQGLDKHLELHLVRTEVANACGSG
jgi:hypothetical protein